MSDATKLPQEQQSAAFKSISAEGLPAAIERQAAAGAPTTLAPAPCAAQPGGRLCSNLLARHPAIGVLMTGHRLGVMCLGACV
jgi:hypothetical protein